jgi:uncharacterized protein
MEVMELSPVLQEKYQRMRALLREMGSVVVGFSGGVDSTVVLKVASDVLGEKAVAVIGDSEAFPAGEVEEAIKIAREIGVKTILTPTHELSNIHFRVNNPDRCYHCKSELFFQLRVVADRQGIQWIADGSHAGDVDDYRPGMIAAKEKDVRSPLQEAGINKPEIRELAQYLGLTNWDKPSFACLSSRFPYGTEITSELLARVDGCEKVMRRLGFRQFRVRHHDTICRLEIEPCDFARLLECREEINSRFKELGYTYITLDLEGYRSGKMNDVLKSGDMAVIRAGDIAVGSISKNNT